LPPEIPFTQQFGKGREAEPLLKVCLTTSLSIHETSAAGIPSVPADWVEFIECVRSTCPSADAAAALLQTPFEEIPDGKIAEGAGGSIQSRRKGLYFAYCPPNPCPGRLRMVIPRQMSTRAK
jgi:hypothetical protein